MAITGVSDTTRSQTRPAERRVETPAAPERATPTTTSNPDVLAHAGKSTFGPTPAGPQRPVSETEAMDRLAVTTSNVSRATEVLETANATVRTHEEQLAKELAQLAPALSTEDLQAYADSYRAERQSDYDRAEAAAHSLSEVLRNEVPGAFERAGQVGTRQTDWGAKYLEDGVSRATEALGQYVRQSPTGDDALQRSLESTASVLGQVSTAAGAASATLAGVAELGGKFSDLARVAGDAFGIVGGAASLAQASGRILDGTARADHYVAAGLSVAEIGLGVAAIGGVTVGLPVTVAVGAASVVVGMVNNSRDRAELERAVSGRLQSLGYDAAQADALAALNPKAAGELRAAGFTPEEIQSLAMTAPDLMGATHSFAQGMVDTAKELGMTPSEWTRFIDQMAPHGDAVALTVTQWMGEARFQGSSLSRGELIERLRANDAPSPMPELDAAADWLAARG
jgi:hypothetical protein